MKGKAEQHFTDTQSNTVNHNGQKGIGLPAVPVLRKAIAENNAISQLMNGPVIQRVKVGDTNVSAMSLAMRFFRDVYKVAEVVLNEFKTAATEYENVEAIVAAVNADERVVAALAEAERGKVVVDTIKGGVQVLQKHIDSGTFGLIKPNRDDFAYELVTNIGSDKYAFHVHPPELKGRPYVPGQIMKDNRMTDTQTSSTVIEAIMAKFPLPEEWKEKETGSWRA